MCYIGRDFLDKNGVRICILGNISLLPAEVQQLMVKGTEMTKHNDRLLTAAVSILTSYICFLEFCAFILANCPSHL